jgi:predicted TIM-barrel fold metal-dependent hydrolase
MAYVRSLSYDRHPRADAERAFNEFLAAVLLAEGDTLGAIPGKPMQDFTMHWLLAEANRRGWVWQVHTGILEGTGNQLPNSDPLRLSSLFLEYPDVRFDLFHIGYPWQQQVSALAKMFPNVFIDMCWAHIISPTASINALCEWVDSVPLNKISAFGGDYCFVDGVYGHQLMARHNVSVSLARKVDEGVMDVDEAKEAARMLFVDNPRNLFGLA